MDSYKSTKFEVFGSIYDKKEKIINFYQKVIFPKEASRDIKKIIEVER